MKQNDKLGAIIAAAGALLGMFGTLWIFTSWYDTMMAAELAAGRPDEMTLVKFIIPALSDIGIVAGVVWAVAAYGFFHRAGWAWPVAVVANVLALLGSFFPMIPAASRGLSPTFALIFVPNLLFYVLLLWQVRPVPWEILVLSLFSSMALVLSFMNGVASTDRIIVSGKALYVAVQRLNWITAVGWSVFTIGLVLKPAQWVRLVGPGAGLLGMLVGFPLGVATTIASGSFSLFYVAPIFSALLVVVLLLPRGQRLFDLAALSSERDTVWASSRQCAGLLLVRNRFLIRKNDPLYYGKIVGSCSLIEVPICVMGLNLLASSKV